MLGNGVIEITDTDRPEVWMHVGSESVVFCDGERLLRQRRREQAIEPADQHADPTKVVTWLDERGQAHEFPLYRCQGCGRQHLIGGGYVVSTRPTVCPCGVPFDPGEVAQWR